MDILTYVELVLGGIFILFYIMLNISITYIIYKESKEDCMTFYEEWKLEVGYGDKDEFIIRIILMTIYYIFPSIISLISKKLSVNTGVGAP